MQSLTRQYQKIRGFTIVEIVIVVAVIGVLATIGVLGYGSWRTSVGAAQVKNDLNAIAAAMESARTFSNAYPTSIPATVTPSSGVGVTVSSATADSYCIDGTITDNTSIQYYIASESKDQGALEGTCATRPGLTIPGVPGGMAIVSVAGTRVSLAWTASANAVSYTAQCASDAGFIVGLQSTTVSSPTVNGVVAGLTPSSSFYCRVNASNVQGASGWSSTTSTTTDNSYGSLAVATSIEGYWTTAPAGYLLEDGSAVSRTTYADLFAAIGTTYGVGNGSTTFNLPDSRGRVTVNRNVSDVEFASVGQITGSKTELLTIAQIPSHTHIQNTHTHTGGGQTNATGGGIASGWAGVAAANRSNTSNYTLQNQYVGIGNTIATNQNAGDGQAHNNVQPSIVKVYAIKHQTVDLLAPTLEAGASISGYWTTAPAGYLLEDGSAVSRTTYADLFAAIGTTYGVGNGSTTFNLPDSRGRVGVNISSTDTEFDTMGEKPGSKQEALTIAQIPSHTHIQNSHTHTGGGRTDAVGGGQGSGWGGVGSGLRSNTSNYTSDNQYIEFSTTTALNQDTGGSGAHNEIQPSIVKQSAIKHTAATTGTGLATPVGTSQGGYWTTAPAGYLLEDGSAVSRTTYADLFAAIGTTYGVGNGSTTFNLPDSRGRVTVNRNVSDVEFASVGQITGSKTELLTIAQIPSHTHIQNTHGHTATGRTEATGGGIATGWAGIASILRSNTSNYTLDNQYINVGSTTSVNQNTGGSGVHNNIQPSIVKLSVIKY